MKQFIPFALVFLFVIILLPNFPFLAKLLPVAVMVLTILTLPIALKRLPNEPRKKIFLFYIGMELVGASQVLDALFAVSVDIRLIMDTIGIVLMLGSFLIKSRKPADLPRTK